MLFRAFNRGPRSMPVSPSARLVGQASRMTCTALATIATAARGRPFITGPNVRDEGGLAVGVAKQSDNPSE